MTILVTRHASLVTRLLAVGVILLFAVPNGLARNRTGVQPRERFHVG